MKLAQKKLTEFNLFAGIRVRQQLTLIHEKAKRELVHLKEMLLQVIMCAEKDAANTYKKEIDKYVVVLLMLNHTTVSHSFVE